MHGELELSIDPTQLKKASRGVYADGDIIDAFSNRRIRCCHAEHICFEKNPDRSLKGHLGGILPIDHLAKDFLQNTRETEIERTGRLTAILRVLGTTTEIPFESGKDFTDHNGDVVRMDIEEHFQQMRHALQYPVFGEFEKEVVYGGKTNVNNSKLDLVWQRIESKTSLLEADHQAWPMGLKEGKIRVWIRTQNFDDAKAIDFMRPKVRTVNLIRENSKWVVPTTAGIMDPSGLTKLNEGEAAEFGINFVISGNESPSVGRVINAKRKHHIDWRNDLSFSEASKTDLDNFDIYVDKRDRSQFDHTVITKDRG